MTHLAAIGAGVLLGVFMFSIVAVYFIDRADAHGNVHRSRRAYRLNLRTGAANRLKENR